MMHRAEVIRAPAQTRRVVAEPVPDDSMHRSFVEHGPVLHPIAEASGHDLGVIGEPMPDIAVQPAAAVLQRLRQVPVIEASPRRDSVFAAFVHQAVVEIEPQRVDRPGSSRNNSRPRRRETIGAEAAAGDQFDIFAIAPIMVGGYGRGFAAMNVALGAREYVPDRIAATVNVDGAFNLVCGGRHTPAEIRTEIPEQFAVGRRRSAGLSECRPFERKTFKCKTFKCKTFKCKTFKCKTFKCKTFKCKTFKCKTFKCK